MAVSPMAVNGRPAAMPFALRPMRFEDADQVAEIEREAFPTLWPPTNYRREVRNRLAEYAVCVERGERVLVPPPPAPLLLRWLRRRRAPDPAPVAQERIVGFVGMWYMAGEAHIVAIAVREPYRRRGIGELLMIGAAELALLRAQQVLTLEVRASNASAQALYTKYGFRQTGLRRKYYQDNLEDAVIMSTETLPSPPFQERFRELKERFDVRYGAAERAYL